MTWGSGWNVYSTVFSPGDFTGDGRADVIGLRADGTLYRIEGNGGGGFSGSAQIGWGWQGFNLVFSPGDLSGDGRADVVARRPDGSLWLYKGDGKGLWSGSKRWVASGMQDLTSLIAAGDLNRDGRSDVLGRTPDGRWLAWYGNGAGGFAAGSGQQVSRGATPFSVPAGPEVR